MTEQIIIHGVDVSWCKHYKHNDKNSGWSSCTSKDEEHIHAVNPLCCEKKDCLYKQLKRKEQECEELKVWKKEHLKDVEFIEENPVIDILNSMAAKILLEQRNEKLKQTLTEIKEISENFIKNVSDRCIETTRMYGVHTQILQKISECEVEDEN